MGSAIVLPEIWTPRPKVLVPAGQFGLGPAIEDHFPRLDARTRKVFERILLMAGSKTNYLSKKVLDEYLGATAFSAPGNIHWRLWTSTLDDTSTGSTTNEANYSSYASVNQTNNSTNFPNATGTTTATKQNGTAVTWPTSTGGSSTITYVGMCDAGSAGNMLIWFDVTSTAIANGDTPKINASGATFTED